MPALQWPYQSLTKSSRPLNRKSPAHPLTLGEAGSMVEKTPQSIWKPRRLDPRSVDTAPRNGSDAQISLAHTNAAIHAACCDRGGDDRPSVRDAGSPGRLDHGVGR